VRSAAAVGPVLASASPDFLGILPSLGFWRFVDNPPAFVMRATPVYKGGLNVLRQVRCAGVVLARASAFSCAGRCDSEPGIAALTQIAEIVRRSIGFVAVDMVYDQKAGRSTQGTLGRQGRATLGRIGPVPLCAIRKLVCWLSPRRAAHGAPYSPWSSSLPSSSSSVGTTISAI
jgi:hypothetical protein